MMPRQTGKSTSAAGYLLWYAMFVPDSTILVAAHKYTGSQEIMQRIRYAYESVPDHIRAGATNYNKGSIEFDNGSRIVSATTTENTGRGMSISLLYADEFAFVRPTIATEFWTSISPTLATGGKAIITSTPNSDEDQFALLWKGANKCEDEYGNPTLVGQNGFKAYRSFWNEHPDRDETWKRFLPSKLHLRHPLIPWSPQAVTFSDMPEIVLQPWHLSWQILDLEGWSERQHRYRVTPWLGIQQNQNHQVLVPVRYQRCRHLGQLPYRRA
jgi:hypothetical protein